MLVSFGAEKWAYLFILNNMKNLINVNIKDKKYHWRHTCYVLFDTCNETKYDKIISGLLETLKIVLYEMYTKGSPWAQ